MDNDSGDDEIDELRGLGWGDWEKEWWDLGWRNDDADRFVLEAPRRSHAKPQLRILHCSEGPAAGGAEDHLHYKMAKVILKDQR